MKKLSRRKIASYAAKRITDGDVDLACREIAAYLIESRRTGETDLVVRSIEDELARGGHIVASVTTATKLPDSVVDSIKKLLGAKKLDLREIIDEKVIGGIKIEAPGQKMDATTRSRINNLRKARV